MSHFWSAVLNNNIVGQTLSQIFDCLSFTSTCWTLGGTSTLHVESISESHVGSVSQRGHDQTTVVSLILIAILEGSIHLLDLNHHLVTAIILFFEEPELTDPAEMVFVCH